jgi:Protein of unknown function (DUF2865)
MSRRATLVAVAALACLVSLTAGTASAEGLFDLFFGGLQNQPKAPPQANFFADPSSVNQQATRPAVSGSGPAFCVRSCDGKYFPLARGSAMPAQMCQAFCPASPTKVFFGSNIEGAYSANGERYADIENAFSYRKSLRADCTCNGRGPAGLAPVDLTLDTSLRPGDVIATTDGLVAYSGVKVGINQTAEFTPIASYPGLPPEVRARLGGMKVSPWATETITNEVAAPLLIQDIAPPVTTTPKTVSARAKRAAVD